MGCPPKFPSNQEARGFVFVSAARGAVVIFGALYASVAINSYADSVADCDGKILNNSVKASSVLSSLGVIEGVVNAILMPFMGTFADLTPYRKTALGFAVMMFTALVLMQSFLYMPKTTDKPDPEDPENFLDAPRWQSDIGLMVIAVSVVIQVAAYEVAALLTTTYAPELSPDPKKMGSYVGMAYTILNSQQLALVVVMTILGLAFGLTSLQLGFYGGLLAVVLTLVWFVPGYGKLGHRREVSDEVDKRCCGLSHMRSILKDITTNYRELFKLLISWSAASASLQSITTLSTSYLQYHLGYSGVTVSAVLGLALLMSVPGSMIVKPLIHRYDIKHVYCIVLTIFGFSFIGAPLTMNSKTTDQLVNSTFTQYGFCDTFNETISDEYEKETPGYVFFVVLFFVILWGLGIGAIYALNTAFYAVLIPGGKESSFYGIKVTFAKLFTWAPPLIFTTINEKTDLLQYAILCLAPFFLFAAAIGYTIDREKGMADVAHTLHLRRGGDTRKVDIEDNTFELAKNDSSQL